MQFFPYKNETKGGGGTRNDEKEKVYSPFQATSVPLAVRRVANEQTILPRSTVDDLYAKYAV